QPSLEEYSLSPEIYGEVGKKLGAVTVGPQTTDARVISPRNLMCADQPSSSGAPSCGAPATATPLGNRALQLPTRLRGKQTRRSGRVARVVPEWRAPPWIHRSCRIGQAPAPRQFQHWAIHPPARHEVRRGRNSPRSSRAST